MCGRWFSIHWLMKRRVELSFFLLRNGNCAGYECVKSTPIRIDEAHRLLSLESTDFAQRKRDPWIRYVPSACLIGHVTCSFPLPKALLSGAAASDWRHRCHIAKSIPSWKARTKTSSWKEGLQPTYLPALSSSTSSVPPWTRGHRRSRDILVNLSFSYSIRLRQNARPGPRCPPAPPCTTSCAKNRCIATSDDRTGQVA
ncbi:hypothetical protein LX32DRAFT_307446 [Colletotrichum zoysiae]|uniref:Uncharacterized protein n=1 Tax=Colletotrichum zoysiae TaxID=1216348 RepID=A0AAD9HUX1_9PEZI|nr:hypothetical protein LX32DRAFT_307446 [Colletotrichum zoysiae]